MERQIDLNIYRRVTAVTSPGQEPRFGHKTWISIFLVYSYVTSLTTYVYGDINSNANSIQVAVNSCDSTECCC